MEEIEEGYLVPLIRPSGFYETLVEERVGFGGGELGNEETEKKVRAFTSRD